MLGYEICLGFHKYNKYTDSITKSCLEAEGWIKMAHGIIRDPLIPWVGGRLVLQGESEIYMWGGLHWPLGQAGRGNTAEHSPWGPSSQVEQNHRPLISLIRDCSRVQSLSYGPTGRSPSQSNQRLTCNFRAHIKLLQCIHIDCLNSPRVLNIHGAFGWIILSLPLKQLIYSIHEQDRLLVRGVVSESQAIWVWSS